MQKLKLKAKEDRQSEVDFNTLKTTEVSKLDEEKFQQVLGKSERPSDASLSKLFDLKMLWSHRLKSFQSRKEKLKDVFADYGNTIHMEAKKPSYDIIDSSIELPRPYS